MLFIDQVLFKNVINYLNSQTNVFSLLNYNDLAKGYFLDDIYSTKGDDDHQSIFELGELPIELEEQLQLEQSSEEIIPFKDDNIVQQKKEITLETLENYNLIDENFKYIARTQTELDIFIERVPGLRQFCIQKDYIKYGTLTSKYPNYYEHCKQLLILICEWICSISFQYSMNKRILIQTQTVPRIQYKVHIFLEYIHNQKKYSHSEILIAATPDMAYILGNGYLIYKIQKLILGDLPCDLPVVQWIGLLQKYYLGKRQVTKEKIQSTIKELSFMWREYYAKRSLF